MLSEMGINVVDAEDAEEAEKETPEAAEQKSLDLANAVEADHAGRLSVEIINRQFRDAGRSYEDF